MKTIIRLAKENEKNLLKDALFRYLKELAQYEKKESLEEIEYKYLDLYWSESNRYPFIMLRADNLIGFCLLRDIGEACSVAEFSIAPEFRRRGYGKQLIEFIIEFCKKKNHDNVIANSMISNVIAKKFWNDNGFQTVDIIQNDGEEFYLNIKYLND